MSKTIDELTAATQIHSATPEAWRSLGLALFERKKLTEAVACLKRACQPHARPDFLCDLGEVFAASGSFGEAAETYERAIKAGAGGADIHDQLGQLYAEQLGDADAAARCFIRALEIVPAHSRALIFLCKLFLESNEDAAMVFDHLSEIVGAKTASVPLQRAMATALESKGRYADAYHYWRAALSQSPRDLPLLIGSTMNAIGMRELDRADTHSHAALRVDESNHGAVINRVLFLVRVGNLEGAMSLFRAYSARRNLGAESHNPKEWDGSPVDGKTILLNHPHFGAGDVIQFLPASALLARAGANVIVECREYLHSIIRSASGVSLVVQPYDPRPRCHFRCIPDFAMLLQDWSWTSLRDLVPYFPVPRPAKLPQSEPPTNGSFKIGLHWAANAKLLDPYRCRSIPLGELETIARLPGVSVYSLQVGHGENDLASRLFPGRDLGPDLHDFGDTAAAVASMDLIIGVDSSVAHVAGAIGKPCLMMLPYFADWRWMLDRRSENEGVTDWYPTVRWFRQSTPGDWRGVVNRIASEVVAIQRSQRS